MFWAVYPYAVRVVTVTTDGYVLSGTYQSVQLVIALAVATVTGAVFAAVPAAVAVVVADTAISATMLLSIQLLLLNR